MREWLFVFLGIDPALVRGTVRNWSLEFAGIITPFFAALLIVSLCVFAWFLYRSQTNISKPRRITLAVLRGLWMSLLVLIAMQPTLVLTMTGVSRPTMVVLIDSSRSMAVRDLGQEESSGARRSRASEVEKFTNAADSSLLKEIANTHDVRVMRFDTTATEMESEASYVASGVESRMADALLSAGRAAGSGGAVLLMSDGRQTGDQNALQAAQQIAKLPVTVYALGVGTTNPTDASVVSIDVPELGFTGEKVTPTVRLMTRGLSGRSFDVLLEIGGKQVASKSVNVARDGTIDMQMEFVAGAPMDQPLVARIVPQKSSAAGLEDVAAENDTLSRPWQVVDRKIRVLIAEELPRYEYRFLSEILRRDKRLTTKLYLGSADVSLATAPDSPFVAQFPSDAVSLGEYDLIVLGDLDPARISSRSIQALSDWVTKLGGSLVVMPRRGSESVWRRSTMEDILPVTLSASADRTANQAGAASVNAEVSVDVNADANVNTRVRIELTQSGRQSAMLRLGTAAANSETDATSNAIWDSLPPIDWVARVAGVKPLAEVLMKEKTTESSTTDSIGRPVMVMQQVGAGQVMWLGTDSLWRFRENIGDKYHAALWGQIVQRLALPRVLAGGKLSRLGIDRRIARPGQGVVITASVFGPDFEPSAVASQTANVRGPDGVVRSLQLSAVPGRPGQFRGLLNLASPGGYDVSLTGVDAVARRVWAIDDPDELRDVSLNENLLKQIAQTTGGEYYSNVDGLASLPAKLEGKTAASMTQYRAAIWASAMALLLVVVLASLEWLLRRSWQLK